jgi:cell division protease FtsH
VSTGANNDLVVSTERARKMVREWGMSERVGPMAWGSQGQVFLGEDLMSTRDYSDETARIIDEEVEQILRHCEQGCHDLLTEHRHSLDLVARALLEHETISGDEVRRLVRLGNDTATATDNAASNRTESNGSDADRGAETNGAETGTTQLHGDETGGALWPSYVSDEGDSDPS